MVQDVILRATTLLLLLLPLLVVVVVVVFRLRQQADQVAACLLWRQRCQGGSSRVRCLLLVDKPPSTQALLWGRGCGEGVKIKRDRVG